MPIDTTPIMAQMEKIERESLVNKPARKWRKEFWKNQSLVDSLYNYQGSKRIPRISDIDQGSSSKLNYILKSQGIDDCYLLTDLMGLARTKPDFIMSELIKVKNDNEVEVGFYGTEVPPDIKVKQDSIDVIYKPLSSRTFYSVSKKEALEWKTSHKALWPVVIEIAYSKHLIQEHKRLNEFFLDLGLHYQISGGISAKALTHLTGVKSKHKSFSNDIEYEILKALKDKQLKADCKSFKAVDTSDVRKFSASYSPLALKIYDKIEKKLALKKIITISFKYPNLPGLMQKTDKYGLAIECFLRTNAVERNAAYKKGYEKWLADNNLTLEQLQKSPMDVRKKFIVENVDFDKFYKISKTKSEILPKHAYLVLDAFEHEGYKYIVIKNPHDTKTKINYKKSKKLPPQVKFPKQIPIKNECMMELNDFYKKLASIDYDK